MVQRYKFSIELKNSPPDLSGEPETDSPTGCIRIPLNIIWLICGGLWACLQHLLFGFLLCITIIGIPWGKQHFKMAALSLAPFGKDVELGL